MEIKTYDSSLKMSLENAAQTVVFVRNQVGEFC